MVCSAMALLLAAAPLSAKMSVDKKPLKGVNKAAILAMSIDDIGKANPMASKAKFMADAADYALGAGFLTGLSGTWLLFPGVEAESGAPTLGAYFWKRSSSAGALWGMLCGGLCLGLMVCGNGELAGVDSSFYGMLLSRLAFTGVSLMAPDKAGEFEGGVAVPEEA